MTSDQLDALNLSPEEEQCVDQEFERDEVFTTFLAGCSSILSSEDVS